MRESREELESTIAATLGAHFPDVELVDIEVRGSSLATLVLFIDRPGGVDLGLCAAVSQSLEGLRERFALEVSSPGLDRRLRKPAHFAAVLGQEVVVRLTTAHDGRRNFRGVLVAAGPESVTLESADGENDTLPLAALAKAHVVYDFTNDGGHRE
ncbi:MAG TPA: ribosome maturation factor RimP [Thermoleophilia bacterium]|nr:ribosome maturation factor RimP [Thermoleophilia bacterium]